ncbi:MAG: signal peptidase II [Candidatus Omnitrophota bacterium]|nr:MAG: signal peptidase II [Candidatus Omnitrophota bacterium]
MKKRAVSFFFGILILDQLSKFIILKNFQPFQSFPVIKNIFHISLVCNKGLAFGLFSGNSRSSFAWIIYVSIVIIAFTLFFYKEFFGKGTAKGPRQLRQIFLSLILAGAVGNLIDRIRFGFVIDFLDFRIWPVFNIADSAITIGTALLVLHILKHKH